MKRMNGHKPANDDEWYTPLETSEKLTKWLSKYLLPETKILCPADILPDGSESTIPIALRKYFKNVRVTRDLPISTKTYDWREGEVIVTNPPFSLLVPFRRWLKYSKARFCVLSRDGCIGRCWTIPELGSRFISTDGRYVVAGWYQNIKNTIVVPPERLILGNCKFCESKRCPKNEMTGKLKPGEDRNLYSVSTGIEYGFSGWYCGVYKYKGKNHFARCFIPSENDIPKERTDK